MSVWLIIAVLLLVSPIQHTAVLNSQCEYVEPDFRVTCTSGTIYIGSRERSILIVSIAVMCLIVCFVVVRCVCKPQKLREGSELLLPGIAQEVFTTDGWMYDGDWSIDPASAAIAGLITIRLCGISRFLDVKSWSFLRLRHASVESHPDGLDAGVPTHNIQTAQGPTKDTTTDNVGSICSRIDTRNRLNQCISYQPAVRGRIPLHCGVLAIIFTMLLFHKALIEKRVNALDKTEQHDRIVETTTKRRKIKCCQVEPSQFGGFRQANPTSLL